ncbi:hypothetical protein [Nannocystis sp. SCPEA4]|uniref:hypothetical protein n=1 Tax=Nannocystis sp. SCPEA4 TaxID=2996787 RepID=UPI002271459C|nr:hypothetical protein [Nannocystis sp. SCPEA4]MCY1059589.1 hypothetical protein [Nannocystis sp. SCPEA4]
MGRKTWIRGWSFALAVAAGSLMGCKPGTPSLPTSAETTDKVALVIRAAKESNGGRPMHVVVRSVTRKSFVEDEYAAVAKLVLQPDESVVERIVVFPGQVYVMGLSFKKVPAAIGIYGLFTSTSGESWKTMAEHPRAIEVSVGATAFVKVSVE